MSEKQPGDGQGTVGQGGTVATGTSGGPAPAERSTAEEETRLLPGGDAGGRGDGERGGTTQDRVAQARAKARSFGDDIAQTYLPVLLGVALGLQDIYSPQASGWLRVPAMVAALLLVAHGVYEINKRGQGDDAAAAAAAAEAQRGAIADITTTETITYASGNRYTRTRKTTSPPPQRENAGIMQAVLVLALWLGVATLASAAAAPLLAILSLVASYLLFNAAYQALQAPPASTDGS